MRLGTHRWEADIQCVDNGDLMDEVLLKPPYQTRFLLFDTTVAVTTVL